MAEEEGGYQGAGEGAAAVRQAPPVRRVGLRAARSPGSERADAHEQTHSQTDREEKNHTLRGLRSQTEMLAPRRKKKRESGGGRRDLDAETIPAVVTLERPPSSCSRTIRVRASHAEAPGMRAWLRDGRGCSALNSSWTLDRNAARKKIRAKVCYVLEAEVAS